MFRLCVSLAVLLTTASVRGDKAPSPTLPAVAPAAVTPAQVPAAASELQPLPLDTSQDGSAESTSSLTLKKSTDRGIRLFQQGDYAGAILAFTAAYVMNPKPMFLFNIAQAHRKAGHPQDALLSYRLFLRKAPDTPLRAETQAYIDLVRAQIQMQRPAPLPAPPQASSPPSPQPPPLRKRSAPLPIYRKGWFWGGLGGIVAGSVGIGVGVYLGTRPPATTLGIIEPTF